MRLLALGFLLLICVGCPIGPVAPKPPPDTDFCEAMCKHLQQLGCEEGEDLYNNDLPGPSDKPNQSCSNNCIELQDKGFFVNARCVLIVPSCEKIEEFREKSPETCQ